MADQAFQIRSISLPSKSHPVAAQIEEHLQNLRSCAASSTTWEAIGRGLRVLGDVYGGIDGLLHLPCNSHPNRRKWVDEELLLSLGLLDLAAAVRDGLASAREDLQHAQISLRRRNCCHVVSKKVHHRDSTPLRCMKKMIANSLRSLQKQVESGGKRMSCSAVEAVLVETREISLSLLKSASSLLSAGRTGTKGSRWLVVCKTLQGKKKVDSEEDGNGEKSLGALCSNIGYLEAELESLFRSMIQIQVSLLNILSF
ncbi:hypothetical protein KSP39_PZI004739 [Platanthera zijinensis]|uniref:Uncharacterized protein n=1 Tax=Platanthera zijinensis TaxID=2320716 RepID=A0AAP0GCE9_9ASPA